MFSYLFLMLGANEKEDKQLLVVANNIDEAKEKLGRIESHYCILDNVFKVDKVLL